MAHPVFGEGAPPEAGRVPLRIIHVWGSISLALDMGMAAEKFGRAHHLPAAQLVAVIDGVRHRGLIGDDGALSEQGRGVKQRVESLTVDLAAKPYESLEPGELDELVAILEPLAKLLLAAPGLVGAAEAAN